MLLQILIIIITSDVTSSCLFYLARNFKVEMSKVIESHIMTSDGRACEALCLNSTRCYAAHLVPLANGSFLCEFVDLWTNTSEGYERLERNPGGRYIARSTGRHTNRKHVICQLKFYFVGHVNINTSRYLLQHNLADVDLKYFSWCHSIQPYCVIFGRMYYMVYSCWRLNPKIL